MEHGTTNVISKKKEYYPIIPSLRKYLATYNRGIVVPLSYQDLHHANYSTPLLDRQGKDTLWETYYYSESDMREIYPALTTIYAILKAGGDVSVMEHLYVEQVDYCSFGNSKPFRIKIVNRYNDNYDYFYVKTADASRIYGLELEHMLSPNRISYIVHGETIIEEHIPGIPGDMFLKYYLNHRGVNPTRIAKEFIKFNERCLVTLLGDMRAYNFVIDITPDFDDIQYRIRAIDFDQQCYEGKKNLYLPQFFKENYPFVQLCMKHMTPETVKQYQREERALIANRIKGAYPELNDLLEIMKEDIVSLPNKVQQLKKELAKHYLQNDFLTADTMGEIVHHSLQMVLKEGKDN